MYIMILFKIISHLQFMKHHRQYHIIVCSMLLIYAAKNNLRTRGMRIWIQSP